MNNNGTHHIQHAEARKMVTEYITNDTQGKNSEYIMYNTRRVNFLWNVWKIRGKKAHLISFEMWCWRRMEKISWTDHVRNEDVLLRVNEQRNILREIRKWKS